MSAWPSGFAFAVASRSYQAYSSPWMITGISFSSSTVLYGNSVATTKGAVFEFFIPKGKGRGAYINEFSGDFEDSEYEKIIMCLDEEDKKVFVINNEIVTDKNLIDKINKKYDLELPEELKGIIF